LMSGSFFVSFSLICVADLIVFNFRGFDCFISSINYYSYV
jgi:hypothetical protein